MIYLNISACHNHGKKTIYSGQDDGDQLRSHITFITADSSSDLTDTGAPSSHLASCMRSTTDYQIVRLIKNMRSAMCFFQLETDA